MASIPHLSQSKTYFIIYLQIDMLKEHMVSHAELRPYVCEFCDAGFTTANSLETHLLSHLSQVTTIALLFNTVYICKAMYLIQITF